MLKKLVVIENTLEPDEWETFDNVESYGKTLSEKFEAFPDTARLYHNEISEDNDVTPYDEGSVEKLESYEGIIYCVVYPAVFVLGAIFAVVSVISALNRSTPSLNTPKTKDSSNNELTDRTNEARPGKRVPDIYGQVRSTPDLATVPYLVMDNNRDVEVCTMVIGRGRYEILDCQDDTSEFIEVAGNSAQFYRPNVDIVNGAPYLTLGTPFNQPLYNVEKSSSVNGQTLIAPNQNTLNGDKNIRFYGPDQINLVGTDNDFSDFFSAGDTLILTNTVSDSNTVNLNGTYEIVSLSSNVITLSNPSLINANWATLSTINPTGVSSAILATNSEKWVGPFVLAMAERNRIIANFIAPNGLFKIGNNTGNQYKISVQVQLEVTPIDVNGNVTGTAQRYNATLTGSATSRDSAGITIDTATPFVGRCRVRARRITEHGDSGNSWTDSIKLRDIYAVESLPSYNYGDVTVIRTKTYATPGALAIKDRKLNCLVNRQIPVRVSGDTFSTSFQSTLNAADIISSIALDPVIGNRSKSEIDFDSIYDAVNENINYFGTDLAARFCYTLDDYSMSFEETINTICGVIFCEAYRQGSKLKLFFERQTDDSVILFNHRNKVPASESRTVSFGTENDYDGVIVNYVDKGDYDSQIKFYIPEDGSAINPKTIDGYGIRSDVHAHLFAYRQWNKIKYQHTTVEFQCTQESDLLIRNNRFLNSDNTRPNQQDGEIRSVNGLELFCSQNVEFAEGVIYSVFLQLSDGTTESIPIAPGTMTDSIILAKAPRLPVVTDSDFYARTTYIIVGNNDKRQMAFLLTEKSQESTFVNTITGYNYSDNYYKNDSDFINGIVTED
ncbi:minor tail protein [Erwinia phage AH03]|uniref:Minor tail protein n=1 Tax=Erwinia phage AH03 TaxID=2869568 RepID=A0AAE7X0L9_9CAUD|nr:minor tail protein [Erwinia phage AH03]